MTIKSILYPFWDKYSFLNNKWWHRLLKVIFYFVITIIFWSLVGWLIAWEPIFTVWNKYVTVWNKDIIIWDDSKKKIIKSEVNRDDTLWKLIWNVDQWDSIEVIRSKYPELSNLDDNTLWSMLATMYDWAWPEEILQKFPELQWWQAKQTTVYGELFDDIKLNNLTEQEMAQYYPEIPESIRGSLFDDIKLNGLDEWELPSLYPELQWWQQINSNWIYSWLKVTIYYILNIIVYIFVTLIIYLLLKLIYYKWVIYIIYWDIINNE